MIWAGDQGAAFQGTLPWQLPGETEDRGTRQARRDGHGGLVLGRGLEGPSVAGTGADHCSGGSVSHIPAVSLAMAAPAPGQIDHTSKQGVFKCGQLLGKQVATNAVSICPLHCVLGAL